MATYTWVRSGAGSWIVTSNWLHNGIVGVPVAGSDLLFNGTLSTTATYSVSTSTVYNSLTLDNPNATLTFTAGSNRTMNVTQAGGGTFLVQQGKLSLGTSSGIHTINANNFTISGGTVTEGTNGNINVAVGGVLTLSGGSLAALGHVNAPTVAISGGTASLGGGTITATSGISITGGQIIGSGILSGAISGNGNGLVDASSGKLDIASTVAASSAAFAIESGSVLEFDGAVGTGNTVTFHASTSGTLEFGSSTAAGAFSGKIAGLHVNTSATSIAGSNFINVQSSVLRVTVGAGTSNAFNGTDTTITLFSDAAGTISIGTLSLAAAPTAGTFIDWSSDASAGGTLGGTDIFLDSVICYAAGTLILTNRGEVPVESLVEGDMIVTPRDGQCASMPVKWMGERHINPSAHPHPHHVAPIRIRQGAFGDNTPRRDLLVSPAHAIFLDGKLVPANLLINHMTITQELTTRQVSYYHLELERHAVILAEGLTSESYLDTGNRAFFGNAGLAMVLHPEFHVNAGLKCWEDDACAPLAIDAETIAPIWNQLAERAQSLGYTQPFLTTTREADLHLLANGRRVRPVAVANGRYSFMLPAGVSDLRLESRATAPADINPLSGDWRPLGVAVRTITLRAGEDHTVIPADHPGLLQGWHTAEKDERNLWRWTSGSAILPLNIAAGPAMLDIELGQAGTYILARSDQEQRLAA